MNLFSHVGLYSLSFNSCCPFLLQISAKKSFFFLNLSLFCPIEIVIIYNLFFLLLKIIIINYSIQSHIYKIYIIQTKTTSNISFLGFQFIDNFEKKNHTSAQLMSCDTVKQACPEKWYKEKNFNCHTLCTWMTHK